MKLRAPGPPREVYAESLYRKNVQQEPSPIRPVICTYIRLYIVTIDNMLLLCDGSAYTPSSGETASCTRFSNKTLLVLVDPDMGDMNQACNRCQSVVNIVSLCLVLIGTCISISITSLT